VLGSLPFNLVPSQPGRDRKLSGVLMAEQKLETRYVKSPLWRVVSATGSAVVGLNTPAAGAEVTIHFSMEWADIEKETMTVETNVPGALPGSFQVKDAPVIGLLPLARLEEVAVKMPQAGAVNLIIALLGITPTLPDDQKTRLQTELRKYV
jgi:hypothetical protein